MLYIANSATYQNTTFGPIAYWSRGFVSNSQGFSLVKSLHWTLDLANATTSPRGMSQLHNLKSYGIFNNDFHNFFGEKKIKFHDNFKDDQNGLIHPEN